MPGRGLVRPATPERRVRKVDRRRGGRVGQLGERRIEQARIALARDGHHRARRGIVRLYHHRLESSSHATGATCVSGVTGAMKGGVTGGMHCRGTSAG